MGDLVVYNNIPKAVQKRRDLAANPVVVRSLSPVEKSIFLATTERPMAQYEIKELIVELVGSLPWIGRDVGLNRKIDGDELKYLATRCADILKRHYGNLTIKDFCVAFELCITGDLDAYLPKNAQGQPDGGHYQNFSIEYVCKVLNAYKAERERVLRKAQEAEPIKVERNEAEEMRYRNATRRDFVRTFAYYKYFGWMPSISPIAELLYYDILARAGMVDAVEVTAQEQERVWRRAISYLTMEGRQWDAERVREQGAGAEGLEYDGKVLARKRLIREAFDYIISEEININNILL